MCFETRKEAALQELRGAGIWKSNYLPPGLLVLWRLGIKARPPHYNPFWKNFLSNGLCFGVIWTLIMWFVEWRALGTPVVVVLTGAVIAGSLFGAMMAGYYRWSARKHGLSPWKALQDGQQPATQQGGTDQRDQTPTAQPHTQNR